MLNATAQSVAARPLIVADLGVWVLFKKFRNGNPLFIVGSRSSDRYVTVPEAKLPAIMACVSLMDGTRSIEEVEGTLYENNRIAMDVKALATHLGGAGLVQGGDAQQALGDIDRVSITAARISMDRFLCLLGSSSLWAWTWAASVCLIVSATLAVAIYSSAARSADLHTLLLDRRPMALSGWLIVAGLTSVLAHELSHCLVASAFGVQAGQLRIQLIYGLFPSVTLKLKGIYTLSEAKRMMVWGAGVTTNFAIVCALLLLLNRYGDNPVMLWVLRINWWMALINLIPFLPTDGYFLAATMLKEPNIRVRSWKWLTHPLSNPDQRLSLFVIAYGLGTVALISVNIWYRCMAILHAHSNRPKEWLIPAAILMMSLVVVGRILRDNLRSAKTL